MRHDMPRISVVMPTLNEARNLPHVLERFPREIHELVLVDGRSTDGTVDVARTLFPGVRVVQQTRRGKGNALACGFAESRGDVVVALDADGSTDPAEIPRFVQALMDGADFVKGSRFMPGGASSDITRFREAGNKALNALVNGLFGTRYTDLCYGYNAFWAHCIPVLSLDHRSPAPVDGSHLWGDGFEIETLMNVRAAMAGLVVVEVPSHEHHRLHGVSNLNAVTDGLRVLRTILREQRRRPEPGQLHDRQIAARVRPASDHVVDLRDLLSQTVTPAVAPGESSLG